MADFRRALLNLRLDYIHRFRRDRFMFHGAAIEVPKTIKKTIRRRLLLAGQYETEEVEFITEHIRPGMNVIELGGSIGAVSSLIGQHLGQGDTHIIVEAVPDLAKLCEINGPAGGGAQTVQVLNRAVSYGEADMVQFRDSDNAHVGRIAQDGEKSFSVPTVKLRDIVASLGTDRPFAVVCDIEGAEYEMFENDLETLQRAQLIILECHDSDTAGTPVSIERFLNDLSTQGFTVVAHRNGVAVLEPQDQTS